MLPHNKFVALVVMLLAVPCFAAGQAVSSSVQNTQQQQAAPQDNSPQPPQAMKWPKPAPAQQAPNNGQPGQGVGPSSDNNGVYVFRAYSREVILHATVIDAKRHIVNGLTKNDFRVFENGQPQTITSFRHADVPVAVGIVIDNSGSMRDKRPAVNLAALNFVRASNPEDEVFIVNFNDEYYLDQDFTDSIPKLKDALERIESRGGTALYDAIVASADHLKKDARLSKKVLLVVTDGEDNASRESLEQAIRRLQAENGPTVYTIGILGGDRERRAKRALSAIAEDTGGIAFFPKDASQVDQITQEVAHDIRNQYIIGYRPSTPATAGGYRTIKVDAQAPGYKHLLVRTKSGYYPNATEQASNSGQ